MLKRFTEWVTDLLFFAHQTSENTTAIRELREEIHEMSIRLEQLQSRIDLVAEHDRNEREKLLLQLENSLLKIERQLPDSRSRPKERRS
jgi:hypothetical protein